MDEFINIWALVLFTWGFPRRKIWDFTVMNNNSSLTGYLHFLVVPCTVLLFLEATVNMDFCNKTNIFCPFILRLNQIGKPLISKIPLSCCNPTSQTWLIKGTKFSIELLSIHPSLLCGAVSKWEVHLEGLSWAGPRCRQRATAVFLWPQRAKGLFIHRSHKTAWELVLLPKSVLLLIWWTELGHSGQKEGSQGAALHPVLWKSA